MFMPVREHCFDIAFSMVKKSNMRWYHRLSHAVDAMLPLRGHDPDVSISRGVRTHTWWYQ